MWRSAWGRLHICLASDHSPYATGRPYQCTKYCSVLRRPSTMLPSWQCLKIREMLPWASGGRLRHRLGRGSGSTSPALGTCFRRLSR